MTTPPDVPSRLFEESSFGSPEACEAYTSPPPGLVDDIVRRVRESLNQPHHPL